MIYRTEFSAGEMATAEAIVRRAMDLGLYDDGLDAEMDLSAAHGACPLRLVDLLAADDATFTRDMVAIQYPTTTRRDSAAAADGTE
jgi:hypothetical protein